MKIQELKREIKILKKKLDIYEGNYCLSKNKKFILERDGNFCRICQGKNDLHFHHITPKSIGGEDDVTNLILLCRSCHLFMHCNPMIVMREKYFHSYKTKNGIKNKNNVGKRGKDKKPRKIRNTNILHQMCSKENDSTRTK